ncbi:MAG: hypothetical protein JWO13_3561 [Acidobacteriales bacterium]|nr:hypothetical protein [Terriglobales bacterium]
MKHEELTERIIGVFYSVFRELGHGFLESVYEEAMTISLIESGLSVERQVAVPVWYHGKKIADFKADLVVNRLVLLELKAIKRLEQAHEAQTLNYLRATQLEVALLFNFGPSAQLKRLVFDNERKAGQPPKVAAAT